MNQPCYMCTDHPLKGMVHSNQLTPDEIIDRGCELINIPRERLISIRRDRDLVEYRMMLMTIIRKRCKIAYKKTGKLFKRDHTTVIHGVATTADLCSTDEVFRNKLTALERYIFNDLLNKTVL